jgi:glycine dehydrogenase
MYAVYNGPRGLTAIAERVHQHTASLALGLAAAGVSVVNRRFFDTLLTHVPGRAEEVVSRADSAGLRLRLVDVDHVGISCSELTTDRHTSQVLDAFGARRSDAATGAELMREGLSASLMRTSEFLTHPVFHGYQSETRILRYLRKLSDRDFALDRGMIPLGSCTIKLNATTEMEPISLPGFANLHPFAPAKDAAGYEALVGQLEAWLAEVTGYAKVSIQPNASSQGELAGLLAIRGYHRDRGDKRRDVCLIPASAHGTNAASAVLAGMRVVVVATKDDGTIDLDDLEAKCAAHSGDLAAIMVTSRPHTVYMSRNHAALVSGCTTMAVRCTTTART